MLLLVGETFKMGPQHQRLIASHSPNDWMQNDINMAHIVKRSPIFRGGGKVISVASTTSLFELAFFENRRSTAMEAATVLRRDDCL